MSKKLSDILFVAGIIIIIAGIALGIILGFVLGGGGFNLVPSIVSWLLSVIIGTGVITISGSLGEVHQKRSDDAETLNAILEKIKAENNGQ